MSSALTMSLRVELTAPGLRPMSGIDERCQPEGTARYAFTRTDGQSRRARLTASVERFGLLHPEQEHRLMREAATRLVTLRLGAQGRANKSTC